MQAIMEPIFEIAHLPVVLFADSIPALGMLMIPKTCAYADAGKQAKEKAK